jgi:hypothetical protein
MAAAQVGMAAPGRAPEDSGPSVDAATAAALVVVAGSYGGAPRAAPGPRPRRRFWM